MRGETLCAHAIIRTRFLRDGGGTVSGAEIDALSGEPPADRADESIPEWVLAWAEESRLPRDEQ